MSGLFDPAVRERTTRAIEALEGKTAAEVVLCVRAHAAPYRDADLLFGFLFALATLFLMMHAETEISDELFTLGTAAAFAVGALACARIDPLRRLFTRRVERALAVDARAKEAFFDLHVAKTHHRLGVLVFVATFEREARVLHDVGLDGHLDGDDWKEATREIAEAARTPGDGARFVATLERLGAALAHAMPDVGAAHELGDEPDVDPR